MTDRKGARQRNAARTLSTRALIDRRQAARQWARELGLDVSDRGRMIPGLEDAYAWFTAALARQEERKERAA